MIKMNFTWVKTRSAYQQIQYDNARRAAYMADQRAKMDAVNSAMASAMQNKTSGIANLAAEAALKRVQAETKAKTDETLKGIDAVQNQIKTAQSKVNTTA